MLLIKQESETPPIVRVVCHNCPHCRFEPSPCYALAESHPEITCRSGPNSRATDVGTAAQIKMPIDGALNVMVVHWHGNFPCHEDVEKRAIGPGRAQRFESRSDD
uniref:CENP-V/GFA domain-containing protein n=1 Tax=Angiostrongylus cantonensis TaxID=6313 RepID=A0A0K0D9A0_ANGCA